MADVQVKMNSAGVRALLTGSEVQSMLGAKARRIAAAAGPGMEPHVNPGSRRARASVVTATPEAMLAEANDRRLTNALSAGRG